MLTHIPSPSATQFASPVSNYIFSLLPPDWQQPPKLRSFFVFAQPRVSVSPNLRSWSNRNADHACAAPRQSRTLLSISTRCMTSSLCFTSNTLLRPAGPKIQNVSIVSRLSASTLFHAFRRGPQNHGNHSLVGAGRCSFVVSLQSGSR